MNPKMKSGVIFAVLGALGFIYFLIVFDTSVSVNDMFRVNNIGLMQDRQNGMIISAVIAIIGGALIFAAGKTDQDALGQLASQKKSTNSQSLNYVGERSLINDSYKLYLTKKYSIERNSVIEKFSCNSNIFEDLDSALKYADELELKKPRIILRVESQSMLLGFKSYSFFMNGQEILPPLAMGETRDVEGEYGEIFVQAKMNISIGNFLSSITKPERMNLEPGDVVYADIRYNRSSGSTEINLSN
jgi:hypothetical protein